MSVPFLSCMVAAAAFYHLPPRVLPSIHAVEGGQVGMIHTNTNNTADLGLMQVNTLWVQPRAQYAQMATQTVFARLRDDACFNIAASAAIMRVYLNEAHGNLMTAIGFYHSHTPALSGDYQQRVIDAAIGLFAHPTAALPPVAHRLPVGQSSPAQ